IYYKLKPIINMRATIKIFIGFLGIFLMSQCSGKANLSRMNNVKPEFIVEEAPEWTALFKRYSGWFGADGIFAIPLNAKDNVQASPADTTMLIFSDTLIGEIKDGGLPTGFEMVNNSVALVSGNQPVAQKIT